MDRQPPYPMTCPSCRRASGRPQRVTPLTAERKSIAVRCERCRSEWTVVVDVVHVPESRRPIGPRLDSELLAIDSLFGHIRTGWRLVESAQKFPPGEPYKLTIDAARRTVAAIQHVASQARLTTQERESLERELAVLHAAIETSQPRT